MKKVLLLTLLFSFCFGMLPAQDFDPGSYNIAFLTKEVDDAGSLRDAPLISDLRRRGFHVDVSYNNPAETPFTPDFEFSYEALADYDLVILGRAVSSSDFTDAAAWAAVETPVLVLSAYLVRNSRMQLLNTGTATRETPDGPSVPEDRVTNVKIEAPDHPLFTGLDANDDGEMGYHTWFYDYNGDNFETFAEGNNGTLLASLSAEDMPGDSSVYVAVWEAGTPAYTDAEVTPMGSRAYFQMGSDDSSDPKVRNFFAFTDESMLLFQNMLKYLLGADPDGEVIEADGPVALYSFEGMGDVVNDGIGSASGSILNGNGLTRVSCGVGNSLDFATATKAEAMIWVDDKPDINFDSTHSFSISLWAKMDPFESPSTEKTLLLKGDNGTHLPQGNGHWYAVASKDNQMRFAIDDNVTKTQLDVDLDETLFPPGEWNHIVAVRDLDQDTLFLFINGAMAGSILDDTELNISTDSLPLIIGNYHSDTRKVNGALDEVALYNYALTPETIAEMYSSASLTDDCQVVETIIEASDDASLSSLTVSEGTLDPAFDPAVTSYKLVLPEGSTTVTITATANDENATLVGDGEFTSIPGTAVVTVTAEDASTQDYNINVSIEGAGNARIIVEPDFDALDMAIMEANDGDTLVLRNGEAYTSSIGSYQISKKIVIVAEEIASLPGLANMPIIDNLFGFAPVFMLNYGADIHLIGIDVDGGAAVNIFDVRGDAGVSSTLAVMINRCRLHNTTEDIFNDARDGGGDNTILTSFVIRNSFVYDSGPGHGLYVKNFSGSNSDYLFENITYWNIGQQFNWIRHYGGEDTQKFVYDHLTAYNVSTDESANKELFGNSDGETEAALEIELKNSILSNQVSENNSLIFNNTSGRHSITINNNVLFELQPVAHLGGTITEQGNMEGVDPQFADPENGDFTVMNDALYGAADDGEIIGAIYWHPDFEDDFSDLITSTREIVVPASNFTLRNAPNPFSEHTVVSFTLETSGEVELRVFDMMGKLVMTQQHNLIAGEQAINVNTGNLRAGMYIYQIAVNGTTAASKMIKN